MEARYEPGMLCYIRGTPLMHLHGKVVELVERKVPDQVSKTWLDQPWWIVKCNAPVSCNTWLSGAVNGRVLASRFFMPQKYLVPINPPGIDITEQAEKELEHHGTS
jgi:hypothetical protein